ncbi:hypothetical protein TorRG33x02_311780 [Trema orientale]|uniref:Retrotransposon Copia-like N-terminal domain-containing protein n=1 Tax=Trema orientale TaxID=63057 RepID=A0A2P5BR34_TREOI|nr:hypothetical protein TorRG33x02_311780 [Trema orientale]
MLILDRKNYLYWRSQILTTGHAYKLEGFPLATATRSDQYTQHLNPDGSDTLICSSNPEFHFWLRHNQFLMSWLLSSISESMFGHISRRTSVTKVWFTLERSVESLRSLICFANS